MANRRAKSCDGNNCRGVSSVVFAAVTNSGAIINISAKNMCSYNFLGFQEHVAVISAAPT